ncbi:MULTISPECIES: hypothetical protein [Geobacter]|uniref:Uncharacterized protein n=1 Tax=Geobacter anodireducens TaxID=1340425 RepID=A0ABR9NQ27_9BACT|nr:MULTISPECIES: hypothetical protein [Geobacter]ANA39467.1 hypothetical protein A2G06_02670 [Geobacter anodireducens]MBE2886365.1 hypothetical protein [Geobacter anodireducens]HMN01720.1 hypothetical protein [Geobacter anodireducens]
MRTLLVFLAVTLLNGAFLYPLLYLGLGRGVSWWLVAAMAAVGVFCMYLLVRYRKGL